MSKVLIVDDDEAIVRLVRITLAIEGIDVVWTDSPMEAVGLATSEAVSVALVDLQLLDNGREIVQRLQAICRVPVVLFSAWGAPHVEAMAAEWGVDDFLLKPFKPDELVLKVRTFLAKGRIASPGATEPWGR